MTYLRLNKKGKRAKRKGEGSMPGSRPPLAPASDLPPQILESQEPFAIMDLLAEMSAWARSIARKQTMAQAKKLVADAFAQGRWVAASDASIDALGRSAIAWAVFGPDKKLAASGESIAPPGQESSTSAEAIAALRACEELDRLGARSALCVCDCAPAIQKLLAMGKQREGSSESERWAALSRGRFDLSWVPREALGPANDAARALLSLRAETGSERPWSRWPESMSAIESEPQGRKAPRPSNPRKALGEQALAAADLALERGAWIACASAWMGSDGRRVGIGVAIFDPQGRLAEQTSRVIRLAEERDIEEGHRQAALVAAKRLARLQAPSALVLCGARPPGPAGEGDDPKGSLAQSRRWFGAQGPYRLERAPADALGISSVVARGQASGWSGVEDRLSPPWRDAQWSAWMASLRGAAPEVVRELERVKLPKRSPKP